MKINAVLPCAGRGERAGLGYNKTLALLGEKPVALASAECFASLPEVTRIVVVVGAGEEEEFKKAFSPLGDRVVFVIGGDTRTASVYAGICACEEDADIIAIHDGARPFLSEALLRRTIDVGASHGSAIPVIPVTDSLREVHGEFSHAVDRSCFFAVQTPQVFDAYKLRTAYISAMKDGFTFSDDAQVFERYMGNVTLCPGDSSNVKLTHPSDFSPHGFSVGCGFDTHRLVEGRKLILGGVDIPHTKGLLGHSDADVLVHAIMDALLSAVHARDIGVLFPDTDARYAGISSMKLLQEVKGVLDKKGAQILNISAVIMAQKPKLKDYIPLMCANIARTLNIPEESVSISATTTEGIGLVGREEGISCHAVAGVRKE